MIYPSPEFLKVFKETSGALSVTESIAIMNIANEAHKVTGTWVELGSYKGKSCISAAYTLPRTGVRMFHLVEPEFSSLSFCEEVKNTVELYCDPRFIADYSTNVIGNKFVLPEPYAYIFVDSGSHQDGLPMQEAKLLEDRVIPGGIIAWHDFKNQFREPAEAADYLVSTGKYEWIDIPWQEIIAYVKKNNLEEGNNSWHLYDDVPFPNFVGAVRRK